MKRYLRYHWRESLLLILSTTMVAVSVLLMPFVFERQGEEWFRFSSRLNDPARPLEGYERFYQFNIDVPHWISVVSDFPFVYARDQLRIDRPVYPALSSLLVRTLSLFSRWPDWQHALLQPTDRSLTFASMLVVNYLIVVISVQVFFVWLKRHLSVSTSFIGAAMLAVSPWWLWQANQAATSVVSVGIIVLVLYLFDNLLNEWLPSWPRIVGYSLLMGVLMLAKAQYDALLVGWLWAASQQRWRVLGGTFLLHWVPLVLWVGILRLIGLAYYNHEVSTYGQGTWFLSMIAQGTWRDLYFNIADIVGALSNCFLRAFSPFVIALCIWAFSHRELVPTTLKRLMSVGPAAVIGFLIAINRPHPYYVFDLFFIIYPLAAIGLSDAASRLTELRSPGQWSVAWVFRSAVLFFFALDIPVSWYLSVLPIFAWRPSLSQLLVLLSRLAHVM